jgi:hypothetical protein
MADFFKNLTNKVVEIASNVKDKAVDVYDVTKLKLDLRMKEADLDECFEKLGRAYYFSLKNNGNNENKEIEERRRLGRRASTDVGKIRKRETGKAETTRRKTFFDVASLFACNRSRDRLK